MKQGISIFLLTQLITFAGSAQNVINIADIEKANETILDHIEIFCDTSGSVDISQIRSKEYRGKFSTLSGFTKETSYDYTYWLHFIIEGSVASKQPVGFFIPKENHIVDVYSISDSILITQKTGLYVDGKENSEIIPFSNIIRIDEDNNTEFYLRIRNTYDESPDFDLEFVNLDTEIKKNNRKIIFDAALQGMMWLMIFYGIFLFFLLKEKLYIYYSLYVLSQSIYIMGCFAFSYHFIFNLPRSIFIYTDFPYFIAFVFYIQFVRVFINMKNNYPKWDKAFKAIQVIIIIVVCCGPIALSLTNEVIRIWTIQSLIISLLVLFVTAFVIRLLFAKKVMTTIIAIGTLFLLIGYSVMSLLLFFLDTYYDDALFIPAKVGVTLELLAFTFGISYRYLLIERDKQEYQKKLIVQLSENAELQGKVTKELEDKVKERTIEISHKNELLEQQKEEVEAQRDEIEAQRNQLETHRDLVVLQKKEITDSINYAQRIQSAILPKSHYLEKVMPEYFIIFKPKDIVSGDFYWIKEINNHLIVVGADCTGHGVPGGFMSMLGITLLNDLLGQGNIDHPGKILGQLRMKVKEMLVQEGKLLDQKDGMDMAIFIINKENRELQYAGANLPLYLIRNKEQQLEKELESYESLETNDLQMFELKGDKQPIGVHWEEKDFTSHTFSLLKQDTIYVFSDGIVDQFGGENRKKYKTANFKKLLLSIQKESMEKQKQSIENAFESWRNNYEQIDDVCVIGVRI